MDDKEESCCTIDYQHQHHKEIFEQRRPALLKEVNLDRQARDEKRG